jgi:hypothetical protein
MIDAAHDTSRSAWAAVPMASAQATIEKTISGPKTASLLIITKYITV